MPWVALALSFCAVVAAAFPAPALFLGMGLAIFSLALGWKSYRQVGAPGRGRLMGAGAVTVAAFALALSLTRYLLTLLALRSFV